MLPPSVPDSSHVPLSKFGPMRLIQTIQKRGDSHRWLITIMRDNKTLAFLNFENWDFANHFCQLLYLNISLSPDKDHHGYQISVRKFLSNRINPHAPKQLAVLTLVGFTMTPLDPALLESLLEGPVEPNTELVSIEDMLSIPGLDKQPEPFMMQDLPEKEDGYDALFSIMHPWVTLAFDTLKLGTLIVTDIAKDDPELVKLASPIQKDRIAGMFATQLTLKLGSLFIDWMNGMQKSSPLGMISWANESTELGLIEYFPSVANWMEQADQMHTSLNQSFNQWNAIHVIKKLILNLWLYENYGVKSMEANSKKRKKDKYEIPSHVMATIDTLTNTLLKRLSKTDCAYLYSAGLLNQDAEAESIAATLPKNEASLHTALEVCNTFFNEFKLEQISTRHAFWKTWTLRKKFLTEQDFMAIAQVGLPLYMSPGAVKKLKQDAQRTGESLTSYPEVNLQVNADQLNS
jgi:hypothetical protein